MSTENRILITGVGGKVGGVGLKVLMNLVSRGVPVRALIRSRDSLLEADLEKKGVELVFGDLTELGDAHRAIRGCNRIYFGVGVSSRYLEAAVNTAIVAKHHGVECFVDLSQMTVSQMSIQETTESIQHKFHWLTEHVLNWSGLPVVHVRPTVFLEHFFFFRWAAESISRSSEIRLPFGAIRTSPIATSDVARVVSEILIDPKNHIGKVYELTGLRSQTMTEMAREYSAALGREIRYVEVPFDGWKERLQKSGLPEHVIKHFSTMASLHRDNRYDRITDDVQKLTGTKPLSVQQWVEGKRDEFLKS
jgi:uncharacterized protein YbjT (DUF2867 family)